MIGRDPLLCKLTFWHHLLHADCFVVMRRLQERADVKCKRTSHVLDAILPEVETMLIRVESCFDDI